MGATLNEHVSILVEEGISDISANAYDNRSIADQAYAQGGTGIANVFQDIALTALVALQISLSINVADNVRASEATTTYVAPREIEYVVDTGGTGDYTSLSSAISSILSSYSNLVSSNVHITIFCKATTGVKDTTPVTINGFTTDSTRNVKITAALPDRHRGVWDASKYVLNVNTAAYNAIDIQDQYIEIDGIQLEGVSTAGASLIRMYTTNANYANVHDCILKGVDKTGDGINNYQAVGCKVYNNTIYDLAVGVEGYNINGLFYVYNNTVHNCSFGYLTDGLAYTNFYVAKNNIGQDCTYACYSASAGSFHSDSEANCDDDSTAPSTGRRTGEVQFLNEANDDFRLSYQDTVAKNYGTNLNPDPDGYLNITHDITGIARPEVSWDIGSSEAVESIAVIDNFYLTEYLSSYIPVGDCVINVNDNRTILDQVTTRLSDHRINVLDNRLLSDQVTTRLSDHLISVLDNRILSDQALIQLSNHQINVLDNRILSESIITRLSDHQINIFDNRVLSDQAITRLSDHRISVVENYALNEFITVFAGLPTDLTLSVSDALALSEYRAGLIPTLLLSSSENLRLNEQVSNSIINLISVLQNISITDFRAATISENRVSVFDNLRLTEQILANNDLRLDVAQALRAINTSLLSTSIDLLVQDQIFLNEFRSVELPGYVTHIYLSLYDVIRLAEYTSVNAAHLDFIRSTFRNVKQMLDVKSVSDLSLDVSFNLQKLIDVTSSLNYYTISKFNCNKLLEVKLTTKEEA